MKNKKLLFSFIWYCLKNRDQRFWQALKNWSGAENIVFATTKMRRVGTFSEFYKQYQDTYYLEDKKYE